jgi:RimJ/RimL family protein N-acetyltransferase
MSDFPLSFTLKDGRTCIVRRATEDDAARFIVFMPARITESDFLNYLPGEFSFTLDEERAFLREHAAKPNAIALVAEVDGEIVATAGSEGSKFRRLAHHTECGLVVSKAFWGQGIGRKLMECLLDWARESGLKKMVLRAFADNRKAITLYKSLGFTEEGRLRADALKADGSYRDTILLACHLA